MEMGMRMRDDVEVSIKDLWDGIDSRASRIAILVISFESLGVAEEIAAVASPRQTAIELMPDLQALANNRLAGNRFSVEITKVTQGSLEVWATITVVGGAAYALIKDYPKLKEGIKELTNDIRKAGTSLTKKVRRAIRKMS